MRSWVLGLVGALALALVSAAPVAAAPTSSISGTVTTDLGTPAVGVQVRATLVGTSTTVTATTGADGTYLVPLEAGTYRVVFSASGVGLVTEVYDDALDLSGATLLTLAVDEQRTGIDAELARLASVAGVVTDVAGRPLAGATVSAIELGQTSPRGSATTQADGSFTLAYLVPSTYRLRTSAPGHVTEYLDDVPDIGSAQHVILASGENRTGIAVALAWASGISGTVTGVTGTPIAGVTVTAGDGPVVRTATTGADGAYSLDLPAGTFTVGFSLRASDRAYLDAWYDGAATAAAATPVAVAVGARVTGVDAVLAVDDATVSGTVTDAEGGPLAHVYVVAYDPDQGVSASATTGADGTYTIVGLVAGSYRVQFMTYYEGFAHVGEFYPDAYLQDDAVPLAVAAGADVVGIDAALARAVSISGSIVDTGGEGLGSASLSIRDTAGGNPAVHGGVEVDPDGTFRIFGLRAGTYTVSFSAPWHVSEYYDDATTPEAATPISLAPGETLTDVAVELAWSTGITGTVVDESGAPMAGVTVWAESSETWLTTMTDAAGTYTFGLPPGAYVVRFAADSADPVYEVVYYDGATDPDLADAVVVVADEFTTGIDVQMVVDYVVPRFTDVQPGQLFADDIAWLAGNGITTGWPDGTFRPTAPVTRGAMAAFLHRFIERLALVVVDPVSFSDVRVGDPFFDDITWAVEVGIVKGWPDGTFRPTLPVTRQAMAAFLYRFAGSPEYETPAVSPFIDVHPGDAFYTEVCWLAGTGIATGTATPAGAAFKPTAPVARQAMAAFLHRFSTLIATSPAP